MKNSYKFYRKIILALITVLFLGGWIIHFAMPYRGTLAWKIDELMRKKKVTFTHDNFFENGAEGLFSDLKEEFKLPEELYITNQFEMSFDETGEIQEIDTFLYGKDKKGREKTYLISYDRRKDEKITVWIDGTVNADYNADMRLEPMLKILEKADYKRQVEIWSGKYPSETYEILYYGRRSFLSSEGLEYIPGDGDGDGLLSVLPDFTKLRGGGEIIGFEISLYMPEKAEITPIRYITEPKYVSRDILNKQHEADQTEEAKNAESWTVEQTNGTVIFFLNDNAGWRLIVTDAAAGSRYYELDKTVNGGTDWERINRNPFNGEIGVVDGLVFFDENYGAAGLGGASQSHSELYITKDGGSTFSRLQLPVNEEYDYYEMPQKKEDTITIRISKEAGEEEGIVFESKDNGETWVNSSLSNM